MKKLIWMALMVAATPGYSEEKFPERMPDQCAAQLAQESAIRDGSYRSEPEDIIEGLKWNWYSHSQKSLAIFDECDDMGFYYVIVDKITCRVTKSDFGVSHGICD